MSKIQIIGLKGSLDECIKALHEAAVVHIESIPVEADASGAFFKRLPVEAGKADEKESLSKALEMIKNLFLLLPKPDYYRAVGVTGQEVHDIIVSLKSVEDSARLIKAEAEGLAAELSMIAKYEKVLRGFAPIVSRLGGLKNFEIVGLTLERSRQEVIDALSAELTRITGGGYELYSREIDEATAGIVIAYPRRFDREVKYLLTGKSINEIRLPDDYEGYSLIDALKQMERRKIVLPSAITEAEGRLKALSSRWYGTILGLRNEIEDMIDEIGVINYAAQTVFTFIIEGWAPADRVAGLMDDFKRRFGDRVMLRAVEVSADEAEMTPVYIDNPPFLKPFEVFLSALPPPKYGNVDPTPFIALFFPLFFGLIVGDIGYGAVLLTAAILLRRRFRERPMMMDIFTVLSISSVMAMVFGALFGELFGDLGMRLGLIRPILFHRAEALKSVMALTIGIGAGHVSLGLIIGAVNHMKKGRRKEASAKAAFLLLIISFFILAGSYAGYLPRYILAPAGVAMAISMIAFIVMEGFLGPLEFIKALGNMLSYMRIMAVGMASVVMALVANRIGSLSENLVIGIIAGGLLHALNIILSVLSPSIQSMRLQYVEFMGKFFEGGGRRYTPFRKR